MDLNAIWFLLVGIMFTGYAVLDGFDLGVGSLHLLTRTDAERRVFLNAIGPVWDGNEVWLVVGIGSLFGAFPMVYATAFSGFYLICILLLLALIFRGVAIEFRSKELDNRWRRSWDVVFAVGSIMPPILFGLVIGNVIAGLPIGEYGELAPVSIGTLLRPYPLLVAAFVFSLFTLHGAIYLNMKTEGELQARMQRWAKRLFFVFFVLYAVTTTATILSFPHMIASFSHRWWAWVLAGMTLLAVLNIPRTLHKGYEFRALVNSACVIAGTVFLFGLGLFPVFMPSTISPAFSLDIYNSASSPGTLRTMLWMVLGGMPFVLTYTIAVYWVFRGKVKIDKHSY
jgi:cytochrome bd ubiquinol oxidase subunit II